MNSGCRHGSTAVCHAWMLLLLFAAFSAVPATAFRTRKPAVVSVETQSPYSRRRATGSEQGNAIAILVSVPRGGAAGTEGSTESTTEGGVEAEAAEAEIEDAAEDAAAEAAAEEEEVVYPTDEIPRSFHTTDGELADDEEMYTDGQNENPAAAVDTIGATEGDDPEAAGDEGDSSLSDVDTEATAIRTAASVAIIADDIKKVLVTDLRYTKDDVSKMRPEIALEVVRNKLARPTEGMPKNWYSDPDDVPSGSSNKGSFLSHLAKKKGLIVSVAVVGAAALVLKDNDTVGDTIEDVADALRSIPKSLVGVVVAAKKGVQDRISPATKPSKETPAATKSVAEEEESQEEEEVESKDTSIHSIKPGTTPNEVPDPDVDHSWLDKALTRIGNLFKTFFNMKI